METLIRNAKFWHWEMKDSNKPIEGRLGPPSWMHIRNGRIIIIEPESQPPSDDTRMNCFEIDGGGYAILPGLMDSHIHVSMLGENQYFVDLSNCLSIESLQISVANHILKHPKLHWIIGVGWDQSNLSRYPNRQDLDAISEELPIFLWRACWHIGVANSTALKTAGISLSCTAFTIEGGVIDIDNTGPTGILRETAVSIITTAMGQKSFEDLRNFILEGMKLCLQSGLTAVHTNDESCVHVYKSLLEAMELPIRIFLTPTYDDINKSTDVGGLSSQKPLQPPFLNDNTIPMNDNDSKLIIDRIKIFSDGSLGAETAAIRITGATTSAPFPSPTTTTTTTTTNTTATTAIKGVLIHNDNSLRNMINESRSLGYRLEVHAIGDAAAEQVLNAFDSCGITAADRAVLTHCQILGEDLMHRMRDKGIIANIQPSFVPTDMRWVQQRLDATQLGHSYAWKTLLDMGVHVAGGSDAPVEHYSPFRGMYDAIKRCSRVVEPGRQLHMKDEIFRPEERLSFAEALYIYTLGSSYASHTEHVFGAIEVGFAADFVFVDSKIIEEIDMLQYYEPIAVMIGGNIVYRREIIASQDVETVFRTSGGPFVPGKNGDKKWISNPWSCKCCQNSSYG